ncbi:hypothetical protein [Paraliomyxa miuraensis]|uniref:hypothetical protein n=1 Tax=Paraliomyxa miuraensis TaxID=376150 RepID=UPI00224DD3C5|nr:hypothetical protein [Paraliomyxa miuraensis]MCX4241352.1 hypothetical protein [Paraliomyxa miuraensis]
MATNDEGLLPVLAVAVLLGGGVAAWLMTRPDAAPDQGKPTPVAAPTPVAEAAAPTPAPPTRQEAWRAKRERIRAAWHGRGAEPAAADEDEETDAVGHCTEECWGSLQLQLRLAGAIEGCRELLPPRAQGKARFSAKVLADPELGSVVDSVEVLEDTIAVDEFRECILESAPLAELADSTEPVSDEFVFRYTVGTPGDNAVDFLRDHPELVERFPRLAAVLERPIDAPPSDEDATAFAQIISTDEAAMSAFGQWMVEQGVDLAHVRADDP